MSDWLDIEEPKDVVPYSWPHPVITLPTDLIERIKLVESCWEKLTVKQKMFLSMYRECNYNAAKASRKLDNLVARTSHTKWMHQQEYATVVKAWNKMAAGDALDADRLLVRQDAIVEELLEPKPILYMGADTGHREIHAAAAAKANEALLDRAVPKRPDTEINVGLIGPELLIQVVQASGEIKNVTPRGVTVELPEPSEGWVDG